MEDRLREVCRWAGGLVGKMRNWSTLCKGWADWDGLCGFDLSPPMATINEDKDHIEVTVVVARVE